MRCRRELQLRVLREDPMPVDDVSIFRDDLPEPPPAVFKEHPAAALVDGERYPDVVRCPCCDRGGETGLKAERPPHRFEEDVAAIGRKTDDGRPRPDVELVGLAGGPRSALREPTFGPADGSRAPLRVAPDPPNDHAETLAGDEGRGLGRSGSHE